jgi:hypothetical protein
MRRLVNAGACAVMILAVLGSRFASAAGPAQPESTYYLGESKMTTADGKPIRSSISLVKRVVDKDASQIVEHVLTINEKESKAFVTTLVVKGSRFTISEQSGSFTGEGELMGEPWRWKEWKSVTKITGGSGTVISEDKLTEHALIAKKTFAGADGKVVVRMDETLVPITPKTYEVLYRRLAAPEKK